MPHSNYSALAMSEQAPHSEDADVHFLFAPLQETIRLALESGANTEVLADKILRLLDKKRLTVYSPKSQTQLLNNNGRVLVAILEDPGITQRALSQYVGVSESNVNATIKSLIKSRLVTKVKENNRNRYYFNTKEALEHPDICRFLNTLMPYLKEQGNATRLE